MMYIGFYADLCFNRFRADLRLGLVARGKIPRRVTDRFNRRADFIDYVFLRDALH